MTATPNPMDIFPDPVMDHLQEQGYFPQEQFGHDGDWYDLTVPGAGTARVCLYPDDGYSARIVAFDASMACEWDVRSSPGTPDAVILAVLEAAEQELAARHGGPVTPAQARAAR